MAMRTHTRGRWFGALMLTAIGVWGLIENFDLVPRQYMHELWKLWPLIPLLIGLTILMRRRSYNDTPQGPGVH